MLALRKADATAATLTQASLAARLEPALLALSTSLKHLATAFLLIACGGETARSAVSSPATQKIAAARQFISRDDKAVQGYLDLAAALCERAEETGDPAYYTQASSLLNRFPDNYTAQKLQATVWLGLHEFPKALATAKQLNHQVPDDVTVWGLLADANFALGNYTEAQKAAQWMFDLRPGNAAAFLPAARLREVFGDREGAIEFLNEAFRRTPESEVARRAFLLAESARLHHLSGQAAAAAEVLAEAKRLFPAHPQVLKVSALLQAR